MIHIATVHWESDKWIELQNKYFHRFIQDEFKVYSFLNRIPGDYSKLFYYVSKENVKVHATKLNLLADIISFSADAKDDILIFIDGDAFPIANFVNVYLPRLEKHKLIAIQRWENNGDIQPHPSFCMTTVGFWNEIKGDWHEGYCWRDNDDRLVTDVGGNLLRILEERKVDWLPLLRTNTVNPHPLAFGVYDDRIYHHAFGFRNAMGGRIVLKAKDIDVNHHGPAFKYLSKIKNRRVAELRDAMLPSFRNIKRSIQETHDVSETMYQKILKDDFFFLSLVDKQTGHPTD